MEDKKLKDIRKELTNRRVEICSAFNGTSFSSETDKLHVLHVQTNILGIIGINSYSSDVNIDLWAKGTRRVYDPRVAGKGLIIASEFLNHARQINAFVKVYDKVKEYNDLRKENYTLHAEYGHIIFEKPIIGINTKDWKALLSWCYDADINADQYENYDIGAK